MNKVKRNPSLSSQILAILRNKINRGEYSPGERIPSIIKLSQEFEVSDITIRHAVKELVHKGELYTEHGRGTFVSNKRLNKKILELWLPLEEISEDLYFSLLVKNLQAFCVKKELLLHIFDYQDRIDRFIAGDDEFESKDYYGIAIRFLSSEKLPEDVIRKMVKRTKMLKIPFISLDMDLSQYGLNSLTFNDYKAANNICLKLVEMGCKKVAYIGRNDQSRSIGMARFEGYCHALKLSKIKFNPDWIFHFKEHSLDRGDIRKIDSLLKDEIDGVFIAYPNYNIDFFRMENKFKQKLKIAHISEEGQQVYSGASISVVKPTKKFCESIFKKLQSLKRTHTSISYFKN